MKLIDADNFDERMRIAVGMCEYEVTEDFKEGVQATLTMLKTEPVIQPHQWIPVTERLPKEGGEYLCCYGKHIHIGQMINGHFRHYGEIADHLITAWMPLPEPYQEVEHEND